MLPTGLLRTVISGTLQGSEVFAYHMDWRPLVSGVSQTNCDGVTAVIKSALLGSFLTTAIKNYYPNTTSWLKVRGYMIGTTGKADFISEPAGFTQTGAQAASACPNQVSLAVTTLTGVQGRAWRGRIYLPAPASNNLVNSQLNSSVITDILAALKAMNTAANADASFPATLVLASSSRSAMTNLVSLKCDTRLDVQRRRANKQLATASLSTTL